MKPRGDLRLTDTVPVGALAFLLVFILYAMTACRTVGPGDSGELTAVATSWGIAHPPGYPLLSLIGNLVHRIPFPGEPAFLLNLLSSFFGAATAGVIAMAVARGTADRTAGLLAGLLLGTSRILWEYSLVLEVFSLNAFLGSLLVLFVVELAASRNEGRAALWTFPAAAAVAAQILTHHTTLVLVAVPVGVTMLFLVARPESHGISMKELNRSILLAFGALVVALLPLLYLPIAGRAHPILAWGDPTTWRGFVHQILRSDYGSGTLMSPLGVAKLVLQYGESAAPSIQTHILRFIAEIPRGLGWVSVPLILLGFPALVRDRRSPWLLFLVLWAGMLVAFFLRVNSPLIDLHLGVTERFYILPQVVLAFIAGWGIASLLEILRSRAGTGAVRGAAIALLVVVTVLPVMRNGRDVSMRGNTFTRDFGANLIEGLPPDAILLSEGDLHHNSFYYQQLSLHRRPDVDFIDMQKLTYPWYVDQVRRRGEFKLPPGMKAYDSDPANQSAAWLALNTGPGTRPIAAVSLLDATYMKGWSLFPQGIWWIFESRADSIDIPAIAARAEAIVRKWKLDSLDRTYHARSWERAQTESYWRALAYVAGLLEFRDDYLSEHPLPGPTGSAAELRAMADRYAGTKRGIVRAIEAETYQRLLTSGLGNAGRLVRPGEIGIKMASLAREGVTLAPDEPEAISRLLDLGRVDSLSWNRDEEFRLRAHLAELMPGDEAALGGYVQMVIDRMAQPATRDPADLERAIAAEKRYIALLTRAAVLSDHPQFLSLLAKWKSYLNDSTKLQARYASMAPH